MRNLCRAVMIAMVVGAALSPAAAFAAAITIPTDSELILNFDLTGETPPPPYDLVTFNVTFGDAGAQIVTVTYYDQLNGGGSSFPGGSLNGSVFTLSFGGGLYSSLLDG